MENKAPYSYVRISGQHRPSVWCAWNWHVHRLVWAVFPCGHFISFYIILLHLQSTNIVLVPSCGDPKLDQGTKYHDGTAPSQFKQMSEEDRRQADFAERIVQWIACQEKKMMSTNRSKIWERLIGLDTACKQVLGKGARRGFRTDRGWAQREKSLTKVLLIPLEYVWNL